MSFEWEPPGPGQWALDRSHFRGGVTPWAKQLMETCAPAGMRRVFREIGTPADTLDVRFINGFMYTRLRGLVGGGKPAKRLPPKPVLKLATRLHPELRRRNRTASTIDVDRPWRAKATQWYERDRHELERVNVGLAEVDPGALTDDELLDHIRELYSHLLTTSELHFYLHGYDLGPIAMLLHDCRPWGLATADLLPLLEGASPSTSEPTRVLRRLRDAVESSTVAIDSLDDVRALGPTVADDLDHHLRHRSKLLFTQYDLPGLTLGEMPSVILRTIRNAHLADTSDAVAVRIAETRARVPQAQQADFDTLLADARLVMDMRDDNGPMTWELPMGILRLSLLELGRRVGGFGAAIEPELAFDLLPDEVQRAMTIDDLPAPAELDRRRTVRHAQALLEPPLLLGDAELEPPLDVLPAGLARIVAMVQLSLTELGMDGNQATSGLTGFGIGTAVYRGRARVAHSPEAAIDALEPGDVLVVPLTTPAYNVVLTLAGAVVTAEGGPMSHAAVLSRELGISAVVGAAGALREIPDGAIIDVDPLAGEVRIVSLPN